MMRLTHHQPIDARQARIKRCIDVVASLLLLIALLPAYVTIATAIWLTSGRPIHFRQSRPGLRERPFVMLKFRTMKPVSLEVPDAQRLTPLGHFLRRTSLDEIPQLINVLRGEMSLVGPRPLLGRYLQYYTPEERRRHLVRPGITGLAQISGRHHLDWDARLALDVQYVETFSLRRDMDILVKSIGKVLDQSDVVVTTDQIPSIPDLDRERSRTTLRKVS